MSETATLQMPENLATSQQQQKRKAYSFTPAAAVAAQAKAIESAKANRSKNIARIQELEQQLELAKPIIMAATAEIAAVALKPDDQYRLEQLQRVREAIEQLWKDFALAEGGKEQQAIATAIAKLVDIEFSLAKRPKPAAYRTLAEKPSKRSSQVEPED